MVVAYVPNAKPSLFTIASGKPVMRSTMVHCAAIPHTTATATSGVQSKTARRRGGGSGNEAAAARVQWSPSKASRLSKATSSKSACCSKERLRESGRRLLLRLLCRMGNVAAVEQASRSPASSPSSVGEVTVCAVCGRLKELAASPAVVASDAGGVEQTNASPEATRAAAGGGGGSCGGTPWTQRMNKHATPVAMA